MRTATLSLDKYLDELMRDLNRFAVGYEPTFRVLDHIRHNSNQGFPPYDLEKISDTEFRLSMAVAGYSAEDLDITEHDGVLTVTGRVQTDDARTFLHKGIAGRNFTRIFYLDQYVYVTDSDLNNGVLTINFRKEIPEALKPRKIAIGNALASPAIQG
jgi:molecular chaperone IbpA